MPVCSGCLHSSRGGSLTQTLLSVLTPMHEIRLNRQIALVLPVVELAHLVSGRGEPGLDYPINLPERLSIGGVQPVTIIAQ